jgi:hypothetical protein
MLRRATKKTVYILIVSAVIIAALFSLLKLSRKSPSGNFMAANDSAAGISLLITENSSRALKTLEDINREDQAGHYEKALDLVIEEMKENNRVRDKSLELLIELQKMASSARSLKSRTAQQLALQAVSSEISLVSHLLLYNEHWGNLLNNLRSKFLSGGSRTFDPKTAELVQKINAEALTINELNRRYHTLIAEIKKTI